MILKFRSGTHRIIEKSGKISIAATAAAFRDICPDGGTCPANLTGQAEQFFAWKFLRDFVNSQGQFASFVPNLQVSKIFQDD